MYKIIVNVDDLGLHPAVARAVEDCSAFGTVSSATAMANGAYLNDALALSDKVGIGAHLNILRGKPMLAPSAVSTLVAPNGLFLGDYAQLMKRYFMGRVDLQQVEAEWAAQIEHLLDMGFPLDHFDSEKHIHSWPELMQIACRLAKRYGVRWVRRTQEGFLGLRMDKGAMRSRLLWGWSLFHRPTEGVHHPAAVWGIADQGDAMLPKTFERWLQHQPSDSVIEICCHPGKRHDTDPPVSADYGKLRVPKQWDMEYQLLMSSEWHETLARCGSVVSYGSLNG